MDQGSGGQRKGQKGAFGPRGASPACPRWRDKGLSWASWGGRVGSGKVWELVRRSRVSISFSSRATGLCCAEVRSARSLLYSYKIAQRMTELHGPSYWICFFPSKFETVSAVSEECHSWEGTGNCSVFFMSSRKKIV